MIGLSVCRILFAPSGIKSSLVNIFTASAIQWNKPSAVKPSISARLAPIRSCMMALCFLSTHVKMGAKKPTVRPMIKRIFTNVIPKSTHIF